VELTASDVVALSSDSLTTANAGTNGDGGDVIVYSPKVALFRDGARIQTKGGRESGNGGFVEVSGKEYLEFSGDVDTSAVNGENGTLLIDPVTLEVVTTGGGTGTWSDHGDSFYYDSADNTKLTPGTITLQLASTNVLLVADDLITVTDTISYSESQDLKLETTNPSSSIAINAPITNGGSGDVTLNVGSGGSVDLDADISTGGTLGGNAATVNVQSNSAEIQDAIDVAAAGASVDVAAGSFTENLSIGKSVTLEGAQVGIAVSGRTAGDSSESTIAGTHTITGSTVIIDGFTLSDPDAGSGNVLVGLDSSSGAIDQITLKNNFMELGSGDIGIDLGGYSTTNDAITNITIEDSDFGGPVDKVSNPMRIGSWFTADYDVEVDNITFQRNVVDSGSIPIQLEGESLANITISENTFTNTDGTVYVWSNANPGVPVELSNFDYSNNDVDSSNTYGVGIGVGNNLDNDDLDTGTISITNNSFDNVPGGYGIGAVSVVSSGFTGTIDATANWWGDTSGPVDSSDDTATGGFYNPTGLGSAVGDHVDYSPWYGVGTNTSSNTGFQPVSAMPWRMLESTVFDDDWAKWLNYATNQDTLTLNYSGSVNIGGSGPITDSGVTGVDGVSLDVTSGGAITIDDKVTLRGNLDLDAGTTLTVNKSIDPGYVDNIVVNSLISAADYITLTAGTDGTGNVTIDYTGANTGSLQTTAAGGDITITAGTTDGTAGDISLNGPATITTSGATGDGHVITLTAYNTITMADGSLIDAGDGLRMPSL
jgi:hypothetical protein